MHWLLIFVALVSGWFATQLLKQLRFVQKLKNVGIEAEATVISQRLVPVGRGASQLLPRVAYHTASGAEIIGESQEYGFKTEFFDGDIAIIVYDPDKPTDFLFYQELGLPSRYLAFTGACFVTLAIVWFCK
jgi:hypothetical protein